MNRLFYSLSIVHIIIIVCSCTHHTQSVGSQSHRRVHIGDHCDIVYRKIHKWQQWQQQLKMNCTIERGAKQSANVQWHHTKNKRQPLEATEQKKSVVGVSVCAIFRAIDTMTRHRQWTCDDLTSNDIHTHTTRSTIQTNWEKKRRTNIVSYSP